MKASFSKNNGFVTEMLHGRKHYSIYSNGKRLETVSSKKISKIKAQDLFKHKMSFSNEYLRRIDVLRNAIEIQYVKKACVDRTERPLNKIPKSPTVRGMVTRGGENIIPMQYVVQYRNKKGVMIAGRSQMQGRAFALTKNQMREEAWNNFYYRLSAYTNYGRLQDSFGGDIDQGIVILDNLPKNEKEKVEEGFVYYNKK